MTVVAPIDRRKLKNIFRGYYVSVLQNLTGDRRIPCQEQKRSTEGCSKFKSPETRQVQERLLVSTLEHMQVPKWDRTRCPEE